MQPRSDGKQRCLQFGLSTNPGSRVMMYQDHDGNLVHHFNIPGRHARLTVTAEALVECAPFPPLPDRLGVNAWPQLDALTGSGEHWEMLNPSSFAKPSAALDALAREMNIDRSQDPMSLLRADQRRYLQPLRLQPEDHAGRLADRRCAAGGLGRLSGFRPHHDCAGAFGRHPVPLCERLPLSSCQQSRPIVRRRDPRVGGSLSARAGLGRFRSDQQSRLRATATSASPSAAIMPMSPPRAACSRARAPSAASWRWP